MKRAVCLALTLSVLLSLSALPAWAAPDVSAHSAIVIDARDASVLYEKDADTPRPMASTTKVMTALLVLETCPMTDVVSVPRQAVGIEGSSAYLYEGEQMTVRDLVCALMLQSANDAAVALAIHASGTVSDFTEAMNARATALGLTATHFENPHGLPAEGHVSTARELALLFAAAMQNADFAAITATKSHKTRPIADAPSHYFRNHNRLLSSYKFCVGGKTGYTTAAGRCLVSAAEQNGARLICATLDAPSDWDDHVCLFEHGFSQYGTVTLPEAAVRSDVHVVGGVTARVSVASLDTLTLSVRADQTLTCALYLPHFAYAPVTGLDALSFDAPAPSGAMKAGDAVYFLGKTEVARIPLYYTQSVQAYVPPTLWERILGLFQWKKSESRNS